MLIKQKKNVKIKPLITEGQIQKRVSQLAETIAKENRTGHLHVIFVLKGAFIFCADLIRAINKHGINIIIDYVIAKSYIGTESSDDVKTFIDLNIKSKEILLVEDIIDTGGTMKKLNFELKKSSPESLKIVCLLDKPSRRKVDIKVDYIGFQINDYFVVGYGLDYNEKYRELPYIGIVNIEGRS